MKKRKSLFTSVFAKYMSFASLFLAGGVLVLGVAQLALSSSFWVREQRKTLSEDARLLSINITEQFEREAFSDYLPPQLTDNKVVLELVETVSVTSDIDVMLTDADGDLLLMASEDNSDPAMKEKLSAETVEALRQAETVYFTSGKLDGLFSQNRYIAAAPITHHGTCYGYVFVMSGARSLGVYLAAQVRMYLLAALIVLVIGTVTSYVVAFRMVRPLRQMAAVTKKFGEGDFSARVDVKGGDEIAQLAESLNEMAVSLSAVEGMSRSFVANVSHELKTPMTTISGFVDGVLDSCMNYPFRTAILNFMKERDDGRSFKDTVMTIAENYPPQVLLCNMNLLGTHDTPRILTALVDDFDGSREEKAKRRLSRGQRDRAQARLLMASFLQYMLPGAPSLYYGDEAGMEGYKDPFNRRTYPWHKEDPELLEHHRLLGNLRKNLEPLRLGDIRFFQAGDQRLGFTRSTENSTLRIYINRSRDEWDVPAGQLVYGHNLYTVSPVKLTLSPMGFCIVEEP